MSKVKVKSAGGDEAAHRGRFQAQGKALEESEAWHGAVPITATEGHVKLDTLKNKLKKADMGKRLIAFGKCKAAVTEAEKNGGLGECKKSFFDSRQNKVERVDLEVNKGLAFVKPKEDKK